MRKWAMQVVLAASLAMVPAAAYGASNIACMDAGYSRAENNIVAGFLTNFTVARMDAAMSEHRLVLAIASRARACSQANGWQRPAIMQAVFYRMSRLLQQALERHPPMTRAQMRRMQAAFAGADQTELRRVLGPKLDAELSGQEAPAPTDEENLFLGRIILLSGIPTTSQNSEYAGSWIGAKMMREMAAERFSVIN